ncbi:UNVERIFIED_CONTAM: hypothetical protein K2H54_013837 [Gekko kuhli]
MPPLPATPAPHEEWLLVVDTRVKPKKPIHITQLRRLRWPPNLRWLQTHAAAPYLHDGGSEALAQPRAAEEALSHPPPVQDIQSRLPPPAAPEARALMTAAKEEVRGHMLVVFG